EAGANRVPDDVAGHVADEIVLGEHVCAVPPMEEVPLALVAPVEVLRVHALQPLHPSIKIGIRRVDEQVEVIPHEAVLEASPRPAIDDVGEEVEEADPITRVEI